MPVAEKPRVMQLPDMVRKQRSRAAGHVALSKAEKQAVITFAYEQLSSGPSRIFSIQGLLYQRDKETGGYTKLTREKQNSIITNTLELIAKRVANSSDDIIRMTATDRDAVINALEAKSRLPTSYGNKAGERPFTASELFEPHNFETRQKKPGKGFLNTHITIEKDGEITQDERTDQWFDCKVSHLTYKEEVEPTAIELMDNFLNHLAQGDPDEKKRKWQTLGHICYGGNQEQRVHLFYGKGSTGKSTFLEVIKLLFTNPDSEIYSPIDSSSLIGRFSGEGLIGAQLLLIDDFPDMPTNSMAKVKYNDVISFLRRISGGRRIDAEVKGKTERIPINCDIPIVVCTNYMPYWLSSHEDREAWERRLVVHTTGIPLQKKSQEAMFAELIVGDNASDIVSYAIQQYAEAVKDAYDSADSEPVGRIKAHFSESKLSDDMTKAIFDANRSQEEIFIGDHVEVTGIGDDIVSRSQLRHHWKVVFNLNTVPKRLDKLNRVLRTIDGIGEDKKNGYEVFTGLKLREVAAVQQAEAVAKAAVSQEKTNEIHDLLGNTESIG